MTFLIGIWFLAIVCPANGPMFPTCAIMLWVGWVFVSACDAYCKVKAQAR